MVTPKGGGVFRLGALILPAILSPHLLASPKPVEFQGWPDSYRISGGKAEATIVPAIGRMMSYRLKDRPNVLNIDAARAGFVPGPQNRSSYVCFGGLYTWPAPQVHWIPYDGQTLFCGADPVLDNGPYRVTAIADNELTMVSPVSRAYGLQMIKNYRLGKDGGLAYTVTLRNTGSAAVRWAIWNLTRVRPEGIVFFPVPRGKDDLQFFQEPKAATVRFGGVTEVLSDRIAAVDYRKYRALGAKLFVHQGGDYVAYRQPGSWFVRRFTTNSTELFTDGQSQIELWADSIAGIFEIEALSPDFVIPPGKAVSWTELMYVIEDGAKISGRVSEEARKIGDILTRAPGTGAPASRAAQP